jgi:hypothetical protein
MQLNNLSPHERKLYLSIGLGLVIAFVVGLLSGVMNFGDASKNNADNWQASSLAEPEDTQPLYTIVTEPSRWYRDPALAALNQPKEDTQQPSLEGQPGSFKLIGIVETGGEKRALFSPLQDASGQSSRKLSVLAEGDILTGDWKLKHVESSKVILVAEQDGAEPLIEELMLYKSTASD